jgi:general secretion pathway protein L
MAKYLADLERRLRDLALALGLPAFWVWWTRELAPLVPAAPRAAVRRKLLRPVLAFGQDTAVLWEPRATNGTLAYSASARIPLHGDATAVQQAGRAAIDALPKGSWSAGSGAPKVVVALPSGDVLRKRLVLPAAVEPDLKQTLAYDLDRHTPFKPEELWFDARVVGRDPQRGEIRVDWAAALRTTVADAKKRAESFGASVAAVTPDAPGDEGPATTGRSRLNLLPAAERPAVAWWRRWRVWAPLAACALVALVAIVLPIWQMRTYVIALTQTTEQARVQADAASALRNQLETATTDYNYVLGRKYGFPSSVQVLEDVTKLLPDDTWLTQLDVRSSKGSKDPKRELLLRGESANAGRLVTLLEESKAFVEAAPRSPTTKIQPGPGEIFDLGAQVAPVAAPPPVQIASTSAAASPPPAAAAPPATGAAPKQPPGAAATAPPPAPGAVSAAVPPPPAAAPGRAPMAAGVAVPPQPQAPPGMMVPRDIPPPPGSVQPPSAAGPPTTTVDGEQVLSSTIPGAPPAPENSQ